MLCKRVHRLLARKLAEWPAKSLERARPADSDEASSSAVQLRDSATSLAEGIDDAQTTVKRTPIFRVLTSSESIVKRKRWDPPAEKAPQQQHQFPRRPHHRCDICSAELGERDEAPGSTDSSTCSTPTPASAASQMPAYNYDSDSALQKVPSNSPEPLPPMPKMLNARSFRQQLLHDLDTFIFDADGVLWLGEQAIEGSSSFVDFLATAGKRVIVLTNNATKSRAVYAKKLAHLGYGRCINEHNIVNPAAVVADVLHRSGLSRSQKKVYLIGGQGVKDEMAQLEIDYFGDGFDPIDGQPASKGSAFLYDLELEEHVDSVGAVVVGYEKYFNYLKLMKAANYLRKEECLFLATNEDETCPGPNPDTVIPDAGPLVAAVKTACGRDPLVVGKPNTPAFDYICRRWKINPRRTLMVGDRVNTDVKFGRDHGLKTLLVLSGCHGVEDIVEGQMQGRHDLVPDFYAHSLGALVDAREEAQKVALAASE